MSFPASFRSRASAAVARPALAPRLLCALALTLGAAFALPKAHAAAPNAAAAAHAVTQEGVLEVLVEDDFKNNKSRTRHYLKTDAGERLELQFKKNPPQHVSGTRVRVNGAKSEETILLEAGGGTSYEYLAAPASGTNALGEQKTAVLLVNFQDKPAEKPWTTTQWNSFMFGTSAGSVNNFFRENSYQQAWLAGQVFGWYTLPINSTATCDQNAIATAAKNAAAAAGVDLTGYSRLVFAFPQNSCSWAGLSSVASMPSQSFINGQMTQYVVGHELGHAFGLFHSHGLDCDTSATGNSCLYDEYADKVDTMGVGYGHFNAAQKERLGWLNYNASPAITTVQSSGNYVIEPLETTGANPKGLKIPKGIDPATGAKTWYYLEYRQPVGVDAYITSSTIYYPQNVLAGVLIHTATDGAGNSNHLLDMTPGSLTAYATQDLSDAALTVGRSYTDTAAGVTITPTWNNSTGIGVDITLSKAVTCTRANPSVVMSAPTASVSAGSTVTYTVAVTNNDSTGCGSSTFNLQGTVPSGWTGTWAAGSLSVGAGNAASTTFTVTSATTATAGSYSVSGKATNAGAATYVGNGSATYTVASSSTTTTAPTKGKGRNK